METNEEEEEEEEDETSVNLVASMGVILNCGGGYMGDICIEVLSSQAACIKPCGDSSYMVTN